MFNVRVGQLSDGWSLSYRPGLTWLCQYKTAKLQLSELPPSNVTIIKDPVTWHEADTTDRGVRLIGISVLTTQLQGQCQLSNPEKKRTNNFESFWPMTIKTSRQWSLCTAHWTFMMHVWVTSLTASPHDLRPTLYSLCPVQAARLTCEASRSQSAAVISCTGSRIAY